MLRALLTTSLAILSTVSFANEKYKITKADFGSTLIGISNDQQSIYFVGEIKPDISKSFNSILNSNKNTVKNVYLRSSGGSVYEAYLMAVEIEKNSLETYVESECTSACTMMFIAGKKRLATPSAKIGFHRFYGGGENIDYDEFTRVFYDYMNINPQFTDRIVNTEPKDVWYPSFEQMLYANVVTTQSLGGETNVLFSASSKNDLKKELLSMELYSRVNAFEPEAFDSILDDSIELGKRGVLDKDVFTFMRTEISKITLRKLLYAPDYLIIKNADVSHDQMQQARNISFDACVKILDGDLNIGQTLPAELVQRTVSVQTEALRAKSVKINFSEEQANLIFRNIIENAELNKDEIAYINGGDDPVSNVIKCSAELKISTFSKSLSYGERVLIGRFALKALLDQLDIVSKESTNIVENKNNDSFTDTKYLAAINAVARANWDIDQIHQQIRCQVEFTQIRGGEVVDIKFQECPTDARVRNSIEVALFKTAMPYAGFESVFQRKVRLTFCYPDSACR